MPFSHQYNKGNTCTIVVCNMHLRKQGKSWCTFVQWSSCVPAQMTLVGNMLKSWLWADHSTLCVFHRAEPGAGGHAVEMSGTESCLLR